MLSEALLGLMKQVQGPPVEVHGKVLYLETLFSQACWHDRGTAREQPVHPLTWSFKGGRLQMTYRTWK